MIAPRLTRLKISSLLLGLAAAALCLIALFSSDHEMFWRAYLFSYLFLLGLTLGSLSLIMVHNLTGGPWGEPLRPSLHAASLTLPLLALLFIPIACNLPALYPWTTAAGLAEPEMAQRHFYLNVPFFLGRAVFYFAVWIVLALVLRRPRVHVRPISAVGLILYLFTMTHAGIDWIMSRDLKFSSTDFGFIVTVGQTLSALALAIAVISITYPGVSLAPTAAPPHRPASRPLNPILNDMGSVLLTLVILWAYVAFAQFLVVWMGNSQDDNSWYAQRGLDAHSGVAGWRYMALGLVVFHFFIPFVLLLFRSTKQYRPALLAIAWLLLLAHIMEVYWLVAPSQHEGITPFNPHWLDGVVFLALAGIWAAAFFHLLGRQPARADETPLATHMGAPSHG